MLKYFMYIFVNDELFISLVYETIQFDFVSFNKKLIKFKYRLNSFQLNKKTFFSHLAV